MARKRPAGGQRQTSKAITPELTDDERLIYNKLLPFFPIRPQPSLLDLYDAARAAHKLRSQELDDMNTRGTSRQRIMAANTELLSKLMKAGMTTERLRQLAIVRQAWPTKKQFVDEVSKPSGPQGFMLSTSHVMRLAPLCKTDDEIRLRRQLIGQASEHEWTVATLWEQIKEGRLRLKKKRPARKKRAGK